MDACWDYLDVFFFPSILLFILTEEVIRMFLSIRKQKKKDKSQNHNFPFTRHFYVCMCSCDYSGFLLMFTKKNVK